MSEYPSWRELEEDERYHDLDPSLRLKLFENWKKGAMGALAEEGPDFRTALAVQNQADQIESNLREDGGRGKTLTDETALLNFAKDKADGFGFDRKTWDDDELFEKKVSELDEEGRFWAKGVRKVQQERLKSEFGPASLKLAERLQEAGFWNSAASAMNYAKDKTISRSEDGDWDLPIILKTANAYTGKGDIANEIIKGGSAMIGQAIGTRAGEGRRGPEYQELQSVFHKLQQDGNFSDEEMQAAWMDLVNLNREKKKDEPLVVLSDGRIIPNDLNTDWLNPKKVIEMVNKAKAPEHEKDRILGNLDEAIGIMGQSMLEGWEMAHGQLGMGSNAMALSGWVAPLAWGERNGREDWGTAKFAQDYYMDQIEPMGEASKFAITGVLTGHKGFLKVANTFLGLGGMLGSDTMGEMAATGNEASELLSRGSPQDWGITGAVIEELPSLALQMGMVRGIGALGKTGSRLRSVAEGAVLPTVVATAGAQSMGIEYGASLAEGLDEKDAASNALKAGMTTAVVTGIFGVGGFGGVESAMARGLKDSTVRELKKQMEVAGIKNLSKSPLFRKFWTGTFGSKLGGVTTGNLLQHGVAEGLEEGIDEFVQTFLTDDDATIAQAWTNASNAFWVGAVLGSATNVNESFSREFRVGNKLLEKAKSGGLVETVREVLQINEEPVASTQVEQKPSTEAAPGTTSEAPSMFKVGSVEVDSKGKKDLVETIFGPPPVGSRYTVDPNSFSTKTTKDGTELLFDGTPTGLTYNPETRSFEGESVFDSAFFSRKGAPEQDATGPEVTDQPTPMEPADATGEPRPVSEEPSMSPEDASDLHPAPESPRAPVAPAVKGAVRDAVASDFTKKVRDGGGTTEEAQAAIDSVGADLVDAVDAGVELTSGTEVTADGKVGVNVPADQLKANLKKGAVAARVSGVKIPNLEKAFSNGRQTIVDALNGDEQAMAELRQAVNNLSDKTEVEDLFEAFDNTPEGEIGGHLQEVQTTISGLPTTGLSSDPVETAGDDVDMSAETFKASQNKAEGVPLASVRIDSGTAPKQLKKKLKVGSIVRVLDDKGNESVWVVVTTRALEGGHRSHFLGQIPSGSKDTQGKLREMVGDPAHYLKVRKVLLEARGNPSLLDPTTSDNRTKFDETLESMIRDIYEGIAGKGLLEDVLKFKDDGLYMSFNPESRTIEVNLNALKEYLKSYLNNLPSKSNAAMTGFAKDFAHAIFNGAWEEMLHMTIDSEITAAERVTLGREWIEAAKNDGEIAKRLLTAITHLDASQKGLGGEGLIPSDVRIGGTAAILEWAKGMPDNLLDMVIHESIVSLVQHLRNGMSSEDTAAAVRGFYNNFIGADPLSHQPDQEDGKDTKGFLRTLTNRLFTIAGRILEAVSRFGRAHAEIARLPTEISDMIGRVEAATKNWSIPDLYQVRSNTMAQFKNELNYYRDADLGNDFEVQNRLNAALKQIRQFHSLNRNQVVSFDLEKGELVANLPDNVSEDLRKEVTESLAALNATKRPKMVLRSILASHQIQRILSRNYEGRMIGSTKNEVKRILHRARQVEEGNLLSAIGISGQSLVNMVNDRLSALREDSLKGFEKRLTGFESLLKEGSEEHDLWTEYKQVQDYVARQRNRISDLNARIRAKETELMSLGSADVLGRGIEAIVREGDAFQDTAVQDYLNESERIQNEIDELEAQISDVDRDLNTPRTFKDRQVSPLAEAGRLRTDLENRFKTEQKEGSVFGNRLRRAREERAKAFRDITWQIANDSFSEVSSPIEAALRIAENPDILEGMGGVNTANLRRESETIRDALTTLEQLQEFGRELEYVVFGGRDPNEETDVWRTVNMPHRPFEFEGLRVDMSRWLFSDVEADPLSSAEWGNIRFVRPVPTENPTATASTSVSQAADDVFKFLGFDPNAPHSVDSQKIGQIIRGNAALAGNTLAEVLHASYYSAIHRPDELLTETGGFPARVDIDFGDKTEGELYPSEERRTVVMPEVLIPLPAINFGDDGARNADERFRAAVGNGTVGEVISGIHQFLDRMRDPNLKSQATFNGKLTPAGLAEQILVPQFTKFLAVTKDLDIQDSHGNPVRLSEEIASKISGENADALRDRVNDAYGKLRSGIERGEGFNELRGGQDLHKFNNEFWNLYKLARAAEAIYKTSVKTLRDRQITSNLSRDAGRSEDLGGHELPFVPSILSSVDFDFKFAANIRRQNRYFTGSMPSLVTPEKATDLLERFSRLLGQSGAQRSIRGDFDGRAEFDERVVQSSEEEAQESMRGMDMEELDRVPAYYEGSGPSWREKFLQEEANMRRALAKVRTTVALALFGGSREQALRFFHQKEFVSQDSNGRPVYHTDLIDDHLVRKLERMAEEERKSGVVSDVGGGLRYDKEIRDIAKNLPDSEASTKRTLDLILAQGGRIWQGAQYFGPETSSDQESFWENDANVVMQDLASRIPGIALVYGRVNSELRSDDDTDPIGVRVPGVTFVGDPSRPMLVFPYGSSAKVSPADMRLAVTDMLTWMDEHGGVNEDGSKKVDVTSLAMKFLEKIGSWADPLQGERKGDWARKLKMMTAGTEHAEDPFNEIWIDLKASFLAQKARRQVLSDINNWKAKAANLPGEVFIDPELSLSEMEWQTRDAAGVVAGFLTDDGLKKILLHSMFDIQPMNAEERNPAQNGLGRRFFDYNVLPFGAESRFARFMLNQTGAVPENIPDLEDDFDTPRDREFEQLEKDFTEAEEQISGVGFTFEGMWDLLGDAAQNANDLLIETFNALEPDVQVEGLLPSSGPKRLSEAEARQIMGIFSPNEIETIFGGQPIDPTSAESMLRTSGEMADKVRAKVFGILGATRRESDRRMVRKFSRIGLMDYLGNPSPRKQFYRENRIHKGAVSALRLALGSEIGKHSKKVRITPEELQTRLEQAGVTATRETIREVDGQTVVERIPLADFESQKQAEYAQAQRDAIKALVDRVGELTRGQRALDALLARTNKLRNDLVNVRTMEDFKARLTESAQMPEGMDEFEQILWQNENKPNAPRADVSAVLDRFFETRADLIGGMASELVDLFDRTGDVMGGISLADIVERNLDPRIKTALVNIRTLYEGRHQRGLGQKEHAAAIENVAKRISDLFEGENRELDPNGLSREENLQWQQDVLKLNRLVSGWNDYVAQIAESSDFAEGFILTKDHSLQPDYPNRLIQSVLSGEFRENVSRLDRKIGSLLNPKKTFKSAVLGQVRRNLDAALGSPDLDVNDATAVERILLERQKVEGDIVQVLFDTTALPYEERVEAIGRALSSNVFTDQDAMMSALATIDGRAMDARRKLEDQVASTQLSEGEIEQEVLDIARQIDLEGRFGEARAADIVLGVLKDVIARRKSGEHQEILALMSRIAMNEQANLGLNRNYTVWRDNEMFSVTLDGDPNEVAVVQNMLRYLGEIWDEGYDFGQESIGTAIGMNRVDQLSFEADQHLRMADGLFRATGTNYRVVDGLMVPDDLRPRLEGLIGQRTGKQPTEKEITDLDNHLRSLPTVSLGQTNPGMTFGLSESDESLLADEAVRIIDAYAKNSGQYETKQKGMESMFEDGNPLMWKARNQHGHMLRFLLQSQHSTNQATMLSDEGYQKRGDDGKLMDVAPLRERVNDFFAEINKDGLKRENLPRLINLYAEAQADARSRNETAILVAGYVDPTAMESSIFNGFLHEESVVRMTFAKSMEAQHTAGSTIGLVDFGFDSVSGRNGWLRDEQAVVRWFDDAQKRIFGKKGRKTAAGRKLKAVPKKKWFGMASRGYLLAAVESHLKLGQSSWHNADDLIRTIRAAQANMQRAVHRGIKNHTDLPDSKIETMLRAGRSGWDHLKKFLGDETWRMMEEKAALDEAAAFFLPFLEPVRDNTVDAATAILRMREATEKEMGSEAGEYADELSRLFEYLGDAYRAFASVEFDTKSMEGRPKVPFLWKRFEEDTKNDPSMNQEDMLARLSMSRARWRRSPQRTFDPKGLELLNVNGLSAPMGVISDMLYRINVAPAYQVVRELVGEAVDYSRGSGPTRRITHLEGREGSMVREADDADKRKVDEVSSTVALLIQRLLNNDLGGDSAPESRAAAFAHNLGLIGMTTRLISFSQPWRQTVFPALTYRYLRSGWGENKGFSRDWADHWKSAVLAKLGKGVDDSKAILIDQFMRNHASFAYVRGADGINMHMESIEGARPEPKGKVASAASLPGEGFRQSLKAGKSALDFVMAKPEKVLYRSIFMNEVLKAVNARAGKDLSLDEFLRNEDGVQNFIDEGILTRARIVGNDMLGQSDQAKKGAMFQKSDTLLKEIFRGGIVTFMNHLMSTSANTTAASRMIQHGDAETRKEGRRLWASNVAQNVVYPVITGNVILGMIGYLVGLFGDDDDEEFLKYVYGLDDSFGSKATGLLTRGLLGAGVPIGYNYNKEAFSDDKRSQDKARIVTSALVDLAAQIPVAGLFVSTMVGNELTENILSRVVHGVAGIDRFDATPKGIELGDNAPARAFAVVTQLYKEWLADASYVTMGFSQMVDPFYEWSYARDTDKELLMWSWVAQYGFMVPREYRSQLWRDFRKESDSKVWESSERRKPAKPAGPRMLPE